MPLLYTPDLVTLDYVRGHRRLLDVETKDDVLLTQFIHEASGEFAEALGRIPMPYQDTRTADFGDSYYLELDEDLLALTTFTNGDGETIAPASFAQRPSNMYPKRELILKSASGASLVYEQDIEEAFSLAGIWGYVPHYPTCWQSSGSAVPEGGMTSSSTTITLPSTRAFQVLQYVKWENEIGQITALDDATLTVTRGELGTTAAAHLATVGIYQFVQNPDIMGAVREIAVYKYKAKDRVGGRVTVFDGGTVTVEDLDSSVQRAIYKHWRNPGVGAP